MGIFSSVVDSITGSAGGIASSVIGGAMSAFGQSSANKTNKKIAAANNALSIELANSAHQREVADLRAAGLNPVLSATGGNGAAVPNMQMASVQNELSDAGDSLNSGFSNYIAKKSMEATVDRVDNQNKNDDRLADAQVVQAKAMTNSAKTQAIKNIADSRLADAMYENQKIRNRVEDAQADPLITQAEDQDEFNKSFGGSILNGIGRAVNAVGAPLINSATSMAKGRATNVRSYNTYNRYYR